jgi:hypothetical protein
MSVVAWLSSTDIFPKTLLWHNNHRYAMDLFRVSLAFLDESEQGSAILWETVGGFSSGAKVAFGVRLIPTQQRQREFA